MRRCLLSSFNLSFVWLQNEVNNTQLDPLKSIAEKHKLTQDINFMSLFGIGIVLASAFILLFDFKKTSHFNSFDVLLSKIKNKSTKKQNQFDAFSIGKHF